MSHALKEGKYASVVQSVDGSLGFRSASCHGSDYSLWYCSIAEQRMVAEAQAMGTNAIICARYASASVMEGTQEMLAYGTAVRYL